MSEFITSAEISGLLEGIIKNSKSYIYILSPYIKINENLMSRLMIKSKNVPITIIYGKERNKAFENEVMKLIKYRVLFSKNLHGKLYLTEQEAIITSMNIYDYSQVNNIEFGMHIKKEEDQEIFESIFAEVSLLEETSTEIINNRENNKTIQKDINIDEMHKKIEMRFLYNELSKFKYVAGTKKFEEDSLYMAISRYAMSIHKFEKKEMYEDKTAIYRHTEIDEELYENIKAYFLKKKIG